MPFLRQLFFPYTAGTDAMRALVEREGMEALNDLFANPPPATTVILHPHLLGTDWQPVADLDRLLPVDATSASLGEGWSERESGVLGEFQISNYLLADSVVNEWDGIPYPSEGLILSSALQAAAGWRGDAYRIFGHENGDDSVLTVVVRFADADEAQEWERGHDRALSTISESVVDGPFTFNTRPDGAVVARLEPVGDTVFFAIGTSREAARAALAPLIEG